MNARWPIVVVLLLAATPAIAQEEKEELKWGTDPSGGAPYVYKTDPNGPYVGFEVEFAEYLARKLGRTSEMVEGDWSSLPELLDKPRAGDKGIDVVLNGYELRPDLQKKYATTIPYYAYRLQLVANANDDGVNSWSDLAARPGHPGKRIGVLEASAAWSYCNRRYPGQVLPLKDVAPLFEEVKLRGRIDVTVQDNPACVHFLADPSYAQHLKLVGEGRQVGYYVIYLRKNDRELLDDVNKAIKEGLKDGTLRRIYARYGLWNPDQEWLFKELLGEFPTDSDEEVERVGSATGGTIWPLIPQLIRAAGMTLVLSFTSFPLAVFLGMLIATGRVYGPWLVRVPFTIYVEVVRGTPLLLQLYFLFFMLPRLIPALAFDPVYTGILGLAMNYAAYEAENYRAGIQSIPRGQMEAALSLGMHPFTAIRRIIMPQAFRVVIPPVTNDFIALFKDTSVCSAILITELTRRYNELYNFNRDLVVELAFVTAGLYLLMSYPTSILARILERRMGTRSGGAHR